MMGDDNRYHQVNNTHSLVSLGHRQEIRVTSKYPPWQVFSENIKIVSEIPKPSKTSNERKRALAIQAIDSLGSFDLSLWTDGSVSDGCGASACISYNPPIENPYKRRRLIYPLSICITQPTGRLCFPSDAEFGGLKSALEYIRQQTKTSKQSYLYWYRLPEYTQSIRKGTA